MKKVLFLALVLVLLIPCAFAESIDLSGLTFEELAALRDRILLEMMSRDDWQEVTVPQGLWKVGESIPAGTWTVKCLPKQNAFITWGEKLNDTKTGIAWEGRFAGAGIYSTTHAAYDEGDMTEYTFTVEDGDYISIQYSSVIFMPYTGAPDFGFR